MTLDQKYTTKHPCHCFSSNFDNENRSLSSNIIKYYLNIKMSARVKPLQGGKIMFCPNCLLFPAAPVNHTMNKDLLPTCFLFMISFTLIGSGQGTRIQLPHCWQPLCYPSTEWPLIKFGPPVFFNLQHEQDPGCQPVTSRHDLDFVVNLLYKGTLGSPSSAVSTRHFRPALPRMVKNSASCQHI